MLSFPPYIQRLISLLEDGGFEAYAVGGAVRDMLRGVPANDYDMTTSATPEEMKRVFKDYRTVETGIAHGTLTVLSDGIPVEITTYRIDGGYTDSRHPDSVCFTRSLREDMARRDFTVNAMAYHEKTGLKDFFGGKEDLKARLIRAVGNPEKRFREDALRILRALRFASVLDFAIESKTESALRALCDGLRAISPERVRDELSKLLCGVAAERVLREYGDVLVPVLPEIFPLFHFEQKNKHHAFDLWEHTVRTVGAVKPTLPLRLAALFHDLGKSVTMSIGEDGEGHFYGHAAKSEEMARAILTRLRFDGKTRDAVLPLVKQHDTLPMPQTRQFRRLRSRYGDDFLFDWLALVRADRTAQAKHLSSEKDAALKEAESAAEALVKKEERIELKSLKINGEDLKKCGIAPGKEMGSLLSRALEGVLDGNVENEKEALLTFLSLTPIECERKLLIRYPSPQMLLGMGAEKSHIEQTYLLSKGGVSERVRRRIYEDKTIYVYTKKIRVNALSAKEYEREITEEEYKALLQRRDKSRAPILKERFVLPYGSHLLEIDLYPFWSRQAILEVELSREDEDFLLPKEIEVIRDVSDEKRYKNAALAQSIPKEEI